MAWEVLQVNEDDICILLKSGYLPAVIHMVIDTGFQSFVKSFYRWIF